MTESEKRPGTEFEYQYPLQQIAQGLLSMPALENPDGRPELPTNGSRTVAEVYKPESLARDFDKMISGEVLQTPPNMLEETGRILLNQPEALVVIAARRPQYLEKFSLTEPQVRACLWEHLEVRLRSEKALQAQSIFGVPLPKMARDAQKFVPAGNPQNADYRIRWLSQVQGMLTQGKKK